MCCVIKIKYYICTQITTTLNISIMTAIEVQREMNQILATRKPNFKKAYEKFTQMNELRASEGLPKFTMPNLQARFE